MHLSEKYIPIKFTFSNDTFKGRCYKREIKIKYINFYLNIYL